MSELPKDWCVAKQFTVDGEYVYVISMETKNIPGCYEVVQVGLDTLEAGKVCKEMNRARRLNQ